MHNKTISNSSLSFIILTKLIRIEFNLELTTLLCFDLPNVKIKHAVNNCKMRRFENKEKKPC